MRIALQREGVVIAGLIYNPANDDLYIAERGKGAFLNDQRLRVAGLRRFGAASLDMALIAAGTIIVREAGGLVSGMNGDDDALKTGSVVCGNKFVHAELVKILKPLGK